eukprot:8216160-Pyramimonas_sp.AAC.1
MRPFKEEQWLFEEGRMCVGSGGNTYERGVGIIVHVRRAKHVRRFCPLADRIAYADIASTTSRAISIS